MTMTRKQRLWWHGLIGGFLGGLWTSVDSGMAVMIIAPREFNLDSGLSKTLLTMGVLGVLAGVKVAVAYLKQSPLPPLDEDEEQGPTNNKSNMKILMLITGLLLAAYLKSHAAETSDSPYAAGHWAASPFASYRVHEFGEHNGKLGGGLALSYAPANNVAVEVETLSEAYREHPAVDSLEEAGVNFKGYLPLRDSGLAPYGFIGYTRNLQEDENRMNAGAGLEYRTGHAGVFADGRWTHAFKNVGHALFRAGVNINF